MTFASEKATAQSKRLDQVSDEASSVPPTLLRLPDLDPPEVVVRLDADTEATREESNIDQVDHTAMNARVDSKTESAMPVEPGTVTEPVSPPEPVLDSATVPNLVASGSATAKVEAMAQSERVGKKPQQVASSRKLDDNDGEKETRQPFSLLETLTSRRILIAGLAAIALYAILAPRQDNESGTQQADEVLAQNNVPVPSPVKTPQKTELAAAPSAVKQPVADDSMVLTQPYGSNPAETSYPGEMSLSAGKRTSESTTVSPPIGIQLDLDLPSDPAFDGVPSAQVASNFNATNTYAPAFEDSFSGQASSGDVMTSLGSPSATQPNDPVIPPQPQNSRTPNQLVDLLKYLPSREVEMPAEPVPTISSPTPAEPMLGDNDAIHSLDVIAPPAAALMTTNSPVEPDFQFAFPPETASSPSGETPQQANSDQPASVQPEARVAMPPQNFAPSTLR